MRRCGSKRKTGSLTKEVVSVVDITQLTDTEVTQLLVDAVKNGELEEDAFDELAEDFA